MAALDTNVDNDEPIASINIIPFVDIVLVLLIIFMLTSAAIIKASFEVKLPRAAAAGEAITSTLNVVVTSESKLFLNGDETDIENLAQEVRQQAQNNPELQAVIAADQGCAYGKVINVIDIVKQGGVKAFALNVERKHSGGANNN
ncbi:MAG: biopolymer transporter ExbD [Deltaproteobacteria bacterium]|nr:biopolymer transporter ExbD [Deltaproteobacteria bacterium]